MNEAGMIHYRSERTMTIRARVTAEDLWRLGSGDVRRELVDGEVIEMAPAGGVHGLLVVGVGSRLKAHVDAHGGGAVVAGDVGFVLGLPADPERVRAPDVAFVSAARLPGGRLPQGFIRGAPDLAVEILPPMTTPWRSSRRCAIIWRRGPASCG